MTSLTKLVAMLFLLIIASTVWSTPITYNFTTTGRLTNPFLPNLTGPVSGSFNYDAVTPMSALVPAGPAAGGFVYSAAITNLDGSVNGNAFSDPAGLSIVVNNAYDLSVPPEGDFFLLAADPLGVVQNFSGFTISDLFSSQDFTLVNARFFWIEGLDMINDFLADQLLPSTLPPTNAGRLGLDFVNAAGESVVLLYSVSVTAVPEPATVALFVIGLAGLGFANNRRVIQRTIGDKPRF